MLGARRASVVQRAVRLLEGSGGRWQHGGGMMLDGVVRPAKMKSKSSWFVKRGRDG